MNKSLSFKYKVSGFLTDCYQRAATSIIVFILPLAALGQAYRLTGKIIDEQAQPLEFVNVSLRDTANDGFYGDVTNKEGSFSIANITQGNYQLTVSFIGFSAYKKQLSINSDTRLAAIKLSYEPAGLAEVTVTHRLPTITRKVDRYVVNVANSAAASGKNTIELLPMLPRVNVSESGSITVGGNVAGVLLNGKLLRFSGKELQHFLQNLRAEDIQSIDIITSPPAKYEAEGPGGLLDIKLKKATRKGLKGSITGTYRQHRHPGFYSGISLSYKKDNTTLYGSYNYTPYSKNFLDRTRTRFIEDTNKQILDFKNRSHYRGYGYRIGIEQSIAGKHTLGFEHYGNIGDSESTTRNVSKIFNTGVLTNVTLGNYPYKGDYKNFQYNLNYRWEIDEDGQQLEVYADYANITNDNITRYFNDRFDASNNFLSFDNRSGTIDKSFDIYSAKLDYIYPHKALGKLETGVKWSRVSFTNDNFFETQRPSGIWRIDTTISHHFDYQEDILAGYLSWSRQWGKWEAKAGLRAEYTTVDGEREEYGTKKTLSLTIPNDLSWFPTAYLSYEIKKDKHKLNIAYNRRISRIPYSIVVPFEYFYDTYTIKRGNPNLRHFYSNNIELSYLLKNKYSFSLYYGTGKGILGDIFFTDTKNKNITIETFDNHIDGHVGWFSVYLPINITKWWDLIANISLDYSKENSKDGTYNNTQWSYDIRTTQRFILFQDFNIELYSRYLPPITDRIIKYKDHRILLNVSLNKKFWNNSTNVSLNFNDIFWGWGDFKTEYNYLDQFQISKVYKPTRKVSLSLTYNFSSGKKFQRKRIEKSNREELQRAN